MITYNLTVFDCCFFLHQTAIYSNQSTPPTPTFGTPFLTCRPREVEEARLVRTLESKPAVESTEMISSVASGKKSKQNTPSASQATCSSEYDSDKSMDVIYTQIKLK